MPFCDDVAIIPTNCEYSFLNPPDTISFGQFETEVHILLGVDMRQKIGTDNTLI